MLLRSRCRVCVVYQTVVTSYRQSLFGGEVVAGYHVIRRPEPGGRLLSFPDFFIEEKLNFRMRWLGCELGELISSVNLLPGEERDISLKLNRSTLREDELNAVSYTHLTLPTKA